MPHNSANVLGGRSSSITVVEGVRFVGQEAKGNTCWYLKAIREDADLAFHTWVVVDGIAVGIAELRSVPF